MVNGLTKFSLLVRLTQGWAMKHLFLSEPMNIRPRIAFTEAHGKPKNHESLELLLWR